MRPWLKSTGWLVFWGGAWMVVLKWGPGWAAAGGLCTLSAFVGWCQTTMRALSGAYTPVRYQPPEVPAPHVRRVILEAVSPDDPVVIRRVILEEEEDR